MKHSTPVKTLPSLAFCSVLHRRRVMYESNQSLSSFRGSSSLFLAEVDPSDASDDVRGDIPPGERWVPRVHHGETPIAASSESDPSFLFELMSPVASVKPDQMSASSLAYLGDVVYELFVRSRYVWPSRSMSKLQDKVVSVVRGKLATFRIHFILLSPCAHVAFPRPPPASIMNAS
jgi:hypothetical protein